MENYFRLGQITGAHGVKGAVRVYPMTEDPNRFQDLKEVYFAKPGSETLVGSFHINRVQHQQNMVLLTFDECTDRNSAELLKGTTLWVDREHALRLEEGEYYVADLMGCAVVENGQTLGTVSAYMETGANLVLCVDENGSEWLLPFIKDCIANVDLASKVIEVHLLAGLRD